MHAVKHMLIRIYLLYHSKHLERVTGLPADLSTKARPVRRSPACPAGGLGEGGRAEVEALAKAGINDNRLPGVAEGEVG